MKAIDTSTWTSSCSCQVFSRGPFPWEWELQLPQSAGLQEEPSAEEWHKKEAKRTMNVHSVFVNPVHITKVLTGTQGIVWDSLGEISLSSKCHKKLHLWPDSNC